MENSKVKDYFNVKVKELPKVEIGIREINEEKQSFNYIINPKSNINIKDADGERKLIWKHVFTPNTQHFDSKWDFIKNAYDKGETISLHYKIETDKSGKRQFLNLIFLNKNFEM